MAVSYKKLWHILIDRDMLKKDLGKAAGISNATITRLSKNETVNLEIMLKICKALSCDIGDIMEIVPDKEPAASAAKKEVK